MRVKLAVLAACAGMAFSHPARADLPFNPFTGGKPFFNEMPATVNGRAVTLVQLAGFYHQMDPPRGSAQPVGLGIARYVLKSTTTGNAAHCEKWVRKVQADETAWAEGLPTFPYLEIDVSPVAKPIMVDGMQVFHETDVRCWEAMDFGEPLF